MPYSRSSRRRSSRRFSITSPRSGRCIWRPASAACTACRGPSCPSPLEALRENWYLMLPLAALVYLLFARLHAAVRRHRRPGAHRDRDPRRRDRAGISATGAAHRVLGRARPRARRVPAIRHLAVVIVAGGAADRGQLCSRAGARRSPSCRDSLADGARQALPVGLACAIVGIIIGTLTLTGAATIFGS